jgi:hypothetical protein
VRPDQQKYQEHNRKRDRQPDKMSGVFEFAHLHPSQTACHSLQRF